LKISRFHSQVKKPLNRFSTKQRPNLMSCN